MNEANGINRLDESMINLAQQRYKNSFQKSVGHSTIELKGKLYKGKTTKIEMFRGQALKAMLVSASVITLMVASTKYDTVMDYQATLHQIETKELSHYDNRKLEQYKNENQGNVIDQMKENLSILDQIKEETQNLKDTEEYTNSQDLYQDAIYNVASDNFSKELNEYNKGEKGYGK